MDTEKMLKARKFVLEVKTLAHRYELPFFVVTDGASGIENDYCDAVDHARKAHVEWELNNGIDPNHDWKEDVTD